MNKKIKFIIPCLVVLITISISIIISISKEKVMTTNEAVSGIAIYVNNGTSYVSQSSVPTGSYYLNTTLSHCVAKGEINYYNNTTGKIDYSFGGSDRCYLYFDQGTASVQRGNASNEIINLAKNNSSELIFDDYGNARYVGANPNNYACFDNGYQECLFYDVSTGEEDDPATYLFRIIGVFDQYTGDSEEKLVKLISADTYITDTYNTDNDNDWFQSPLNTTLNDTYLSDLNKYYQRDLIANVIYNLGGFDSDNLFSNGLVKNYYENERGSAVYWDNNAMWSGKIALMYVSDYGYATSGGSACLNSYYLFKYGEDYETIGSNSWASYSTCYTNDWLLYPGARTGTQGTATSQWTVSNLSNDSYVFSVDSTGGIDGGYADRALMSVRPTFYLKSDVYIKGGTGTSTDPYIISTMNAADEIELLASKDKTNLVTDDDGNVRYIGANPNNYACLSIDGTTCMNYNKDDAANKTDGLFRIIGVFNEGTYGYYTDNMIEMPLIKLITADKLANTSIIWDYKQSGVSSSTSAYGSNDWSDSQLMYMLNGSVGNNKGYQSLAPVYGTTTPIRSLTIDNYNIYYDESNYFYTNYDGEGYADDSRYASRTLNVPAMVASGSNYTPSSITVMSLTRYQTNFIVYVVWHLGGYESSSIKTSQFYTYERSSNVYSGRPYTWIGGIGLMYVSDYGYATSGGSTYNRNTCLTSYNLTNWNSYSDCYTNDWLLYPGARTGTQGTATTQWTMTAASYSPSVVFLIGSGGRVGNNDARGSFAVRPTFYVSPRAYISGGTGTSTDPYMLTIIYQS